ncbi:hypothetical protein OS493_010306 [Desmophyllum pertusum]|uniref:Uncharacterized protein n=1 Tax=Desmophyllum pertusum TaxID=174260 RepID=A0A9X0DAE4_9CNID|nr:hypothetical protein OS493_010306 [Desmophyllum pertusum]
MIGSRLSHLFWCLQLHISLQKAHQRRNRKKQMNNFMLASSRPCLNFNFLDSSNPLDRKRIMYRGSLGELVDVQDVSH